ncbi:hypothetical protein [Vibrio sp. 11-4(1)]|uniref:hypothetical protein n=1 Tax=Vibrio sp. 11-4(1) TaxID=2591018 RepID=UPI001481D7BF|nr:hypothetical protein [Vibrio sp. 11-4(1)]NNN82164.1 hypothetical protein [Vibrio sp. 11-4(1)]
MRLSHRKKVASKHGLYWPSRTKQSRERREARAVLAVKSATVVAQVSVVVAAGQQFAQAIASATRAMVKGANELKTWLINRDSSQRKVNSPRDSHTGKILIKAPQNDSF